MKNTFFAWLIAGVLFAPAISHAREIKALAGTVTTCIFAKNVSGGHIDVELLIPQGTDVHEFSLRPQDMKRLKDSSALILSGAGLDEHIGKKARSVGVKTFDASEGIKTEKLGRVIDPHVWLDPSLAEVQVRNISKALSFLDKKNSVDYETNANDYIQRLKKLDSEIAGSLKEMKGQYLITYHEAFGYFARRYGLIHYALRDASAGQTSPARLKEVYDMIRRNNVKAVFVESQFPPESMETLKRQLKVKVCTLDTIETGEIESSYYEKAMMENTRRIIECLK